jgi:hypothetical protein
MGPIPGSLRFPNFIEMYSYSPAGGVVAKQLIYTANYVDNYGVEQTSSSPLEADYTFDTYGRVATLLNPANPLQYQSGADPYTGNPIYSPCTLQYAYDAMGRASTLANVVNYSGCGFTWASAEYDYAGRMTSMSATGINSYYQSSYASESRTYNNTTGQLSSETLYATGSI